MAKQFLSAISCYPGAVGSPGLYLGSDTSTGFYRIGANNIGVAVSGSKVLDIASTGLSVSGQVTSTSLYISGNITLSQGTGSTSNNLKLKGQGSGGQGISFYDYTDVWQGQLYMAATSYGFLNSNWGAWDLSKAVNGQLSITVSSVSQTVLHTGNYNSYSPTLTGTGASGTWGISVTGNAGTATTLQTPRSIGGASFNGSADIIPNYIADTGYRRIVNPSGGTSGNGASTETGAIRIALPVNGSVNTMVRVTVKIYEYTTNESFEVHAGGYVYTYTGNTWANNPYAYIIGNPSINRNFTIRFGYTASGEMCIYIGELASTWSYPNVHVTEVQCGHAGQSINWTTGWAVGYEASAFESVTATISNCQVGQLSTATPLVASGAGSVGTSSLVSRQDHVHPVQTTVSGNAGTATTLQTPRTINGTNFDGSANITTSSWGTARTITIGSTGKSVDGSAAVSWNLTEIGAAASGHNHSGVYEPANANIQSHIGSTSNPHSVTKSQVGLSAVENTALSTWAGSTNITTLGTITTGTWNAGAVTSSGTVTGTNLSGTNTGDNAANTRYANDYRAANFVAGTDFLAPNGNGSQLTNLPASSPSSDIFAFAAAYG